MINTILNYLFCLSPLNPRASKYISDESERLASGFTNFTFE